MWHINYFFWYTSRVALEELHQGKYQYWLKHNMNMDAKFLEKRTSGNMVLDVWKYLSCYDPLMYCSVSLIWFLHPTVLTKRSKSSMAHEMTEHRTTALPKLALQPGAYCVKLEIGQLHFRNLRCSQGHTVCSWTPNHPKPYLNLVAQCVYDTWTWLHSVYTVSYTHLTLPTIYSV